MNKLKEQIKKLKDDEIRSLRGWINQQFAQKSIRAKYTPEQYSDYMGCKKRLNCHWNSKLKRCIYDTPKSKKKAQQ